MRLVEVQLVRWTDRFGVLHRYSRGETKRSPVARLDHYKTALSLTLSLTRSLSLALSLSLQLGGG